MILIVYALYLIYTMQTYSFYFFNKVQQKNLKFASHHHLLAPCVTFNLKDPSPPSHIQPPYTIIIFFLFIPSTPSHSDVSYIWSILDPYLNPKGMILYISIGLTY